MESTKSAQRIKSILTALAKARRTVASIRHPSDLPVWAAEEALVAAERAVTRLKYRERV